MTQEELGISDTGMRYIEAILARAIAEEEYRHYRLCFQRGGHVNPYEEKVKEANEVVEHCREMSRAEQLNAYRERGLL